LISTKKQRNFFENEEKTQRVEAGEQKIEKKVFKIFSLLPILII
jgi:hypothetical protein